MGKMRAMKLDEGAIWSHGSDGASHFFEFEIRVPRGTFVP